MAHLSQAVNTKCHDLDKHWIKRKVGFDVVLFEPLAKMTLKINSTTKDQEQRKNYKNTREFSILIWNLHPIISVVYE